MSSPSSSVLPPEALLTTLLRLRADVLHEGQQRYERWSASIRRRSFCAGALNLSYYLAFRTVDLRQIQASLQALGLSSLGRSEARVIENLDAVIAALGAILGKLTAKSHLPKRPTPQRFFRGQRMLDYHSLHVLGAAEPDRRVRIMVTLPTEAADSVSFLSDLLQRGTNWVRINCAHDDTTIWQRMVDNVHAAEVKTGRHCRILMDLGGPKVRTGQVLSERKRVMMDEAILLTREPPVKSKKFPFQAQCEIPEVFEQVKVGDGAWIDDGKIGAVVESIHPKGLVLRVTRVSPDGAKLKPEKGLNFPDTTLPIAALTEKDIADLAFVAAHADAVGYSFVQTAEDVQRLQAELSQLNAHKVAVIAKIETQLAIDNLPDIIVQAGGNSLFGVMIARGDMAVEIGFQRTAEMQEEILWLCEAAHIPVIWATQVLENMVKHGIPTRAEMTDAAMAQRAECVMLNKGVHIAEAVSLLNDVLKRMRQHQLKKTPQLRALRSWIDEDTD